MAEMLDEKSSIESTTIGVYRTSATVKGGRRFSFGALVVIGNRNGEVGFGYAKGAEVPNAIEKSQKAGQRTLFKLQRNGTTIHHEVHGKYGAASVKIFPASPGTGVIAGSVLRAVLELAGIQDCMTKCYGNTNPQNVLRAAFDALKSLRTPDSIASLRKVTLEETEISKKIEKGKAFMPAIRKGEKARGPVNNIGNDRKGGRGGGGGGGRGGPRGGGGGGGPRGAAPDAAPAAAPAN